MGQAATTARKPRKAKAAAAEVVIAYKGFDRQLRCRDFQYEIGKTYQHDGDVAACASGFHACEYPLDVLGYYAPSESRFAIVEQSGSLARHSGDSKVASGTITIKAEVGLPGLIKAAIEYTFVRAKPIDPASPASSTGDYGAASSTGHQGAASSTGTRGAASSTGDCGAASSTGHQGAASSTGTRGAAMAAGYQGRAMGAEGNALFLVERDDNYHIVAVWAGVAGRDGIKPGAWYVLRGGKPVEVKLAEVTS